MQDKTTKKLYRENEQWEQKSHAHQKKKKCQMSATSAVVSIETDLKWRPHW